MSAGVILLALSFLILTTVVFLKTRHVTELEESIDIQREEICLLTADLNKLSSQKKSSEVRLGQIGEHFAPFLTEFPYNPKDVRFLGSPIDLIAFDFDSGKLVFIEFKTGGSQQTKRQRMVRDMVESGNVFYEIIRVNKEVSSKMSGNGLTSANSVSAASVNKRAEAKAVADDEAKAVAAANAARVEADRVVAEEAKLVAEAKRVARDKETADKAEAKRVAVGVATKVEPKDVNLKAEVHPIKKEKDGA